MLYHSLTAFEKHLSSAAPNHFAPLYLVALAQADERRHLLLQIGKKISKTSPQIVESLSLLEELQSLNLFEQDRLLLCDPVEKIASIPSSNVTLLLGAPSWSSFGHLQILAKQKAIALDLSKEKPWERQKRIRVWLLSHALHAKKTLHEDALSLLIDRVGLDFALLRSEIDKAICFIAEKPAIERSDIEQIAPPLPQLITWNTAENAVWGKPEIFESLDLPTYLQLLAQVRYHLELGLELSSRENLPHIKPYQIDKYRSAAQQRGSYYFLRALQTVAQAEMLAKDQTLPPLVQWEKVLGILK